MYKRQFDRRHPRYHWGPWGWSTRRKPRKRRIIPRPRLPRRRRGILSMLFFGPRRRRH